MTNTTEEIIARVGNVAAKMEGELSAVGKLEFAKPWKALIDADLAELGARFDELEQTYAALSKLIGNLEDEARETHLQSDDARATTTGQAYCIDSCVQSLRAALSAPCPCEGLRAERDSLRAQWKITEAEYRAGLTALRAENESLRTELQKEQAYRVTWQQVALDLYEASAAEKGEVEEARAAFRELADGGEPYKSLRAEVDRLKDEIHVWEESDEAGPVFADLLEEAKRELAASRETATTLRRRIHQAEGHNQFFERCESGWCNPSPKADPAAEGVGKAWKTPAEYETALAASRERERGLREARERLIDFIRRIFGPKYDKEIAALATPEGTK